MKRFALLNFFIVLLGFAVVATAVEVQVKPERLNPNGKKARMKVVVRDIDTEGVTTPSITLNGIAAIKTKVNPKKVTAFFYKNDVVATFGAVEKGQVVTLDIAISVGDAPATHFSDEVKIVGKKKNTPNAPENPQVPDVPSANRPF